MTARRLVACAALAVLTLGSMACGKPYQVASAPGFVKLQNAQEPYDWRAVAPDGVVVALRVVPTEAHTDLGFWAHAVTLRMREMDEYALLSTHAITSRDGTPGTELVFGHDENGKPFLYRVRLFVSEKRLFVVEAGGAKEQMDRYQASVDWMLASVRVM